MRKASAARARTRAHLEEAPAPNRVHQCACGWKMPTNLQLHGEGLSELPQESLYFSFCCPQCGAEVSGRSAKEAAKGPPGANA